jgi:paraquat-inducible protein A
VTSSTKPIPSSADVPAQPGAAAMACPWCGQLHERIPLRPGDTCQCVRCNAPLARGRASNWLVTLAWALTGLILWVPANLLPIVSVSQLGTTHHSLLFTGATALWREGMPWIAVLVTLCGIVAPLLLLLALLFLLVPITLSRPSARLGLVVRWLHALELWSIPEVYLLAVLVAFIKLGDVVHAEPAAGLGCHVAMSLALLIAWRRFDVDAATEVLATERMKGAVT